MNRRWCFRRIAEERVDGAFVEAVFAVAKIVANENLAAFTERAIDLLAAERAKHVAHLFPVFGRVVGNRPRGEQTYGFFMEQPCEKFTDRQLE